MQLDFFDTTHNTILTTQSYDRFKRELIESNCTRCDLHKGRTQIVVDRGNSKSNIMLIGEGPGENEDKQGKAFVGRAGQLMDELFLEIGIDTSRDTLIANIVKCRPPENRAPHQEEAKTCMVFLKHQISLVRPKIILLLGATALKYLVPSKTKFSMNDEAGKFFTAPEFSETLLMVLYHPAYLLYDARKKTPMREHLLSLRELLKQNDWLPPPPVANGSRSAGISFPTR
ncbi:MAG: uracil-DNA glycosylase [Candidatus Omnitrophica bacterium]|nr:uracil-DNA glycosylase [Candidatus Omnitrophota bacterium]